MIAVRVLTGAVIVALALLALQTHRVGENRAELTQANANLDTAEAANNSLAQAVARLDMSRKALVDAATQSQQRANERSRDASRYAQELKKLRSENEALNQYLNRTIPHDLACRVFPMPGEGGNGNRNSAGERAGVSACADPEAYLPVSHQAGWEWARLTDKALDACNADKAAYLEAIQ